MRRCTTAPKRRPYYRMLSRNFSGLQERQYAILLQARRQRGKSLSSSRDLPCYPECRRSGRIPIDLERDEHCHSPRMVSRHAARSTTTPLGASQQRQCEIGGLTCSSISTDRGYTFRCCIVGRKTRGERHEISSPSIIT